jgi:hypothetical protein
MHKEKPWKSESANLQCVLLSMKKLDGHSTLHVPAAVVSVSRLVGEEMAKLRKVPTATQPQLRKVLFRWGGALVTYHAITLGVV